MKINVHVEIEKREDEPKMKAVTTPISSDKTLMLVHLVPEDDEWSEFVESACRPAYYMMVIWDMLDTLNERDREFMFRKCETLRRDYEEINDHFRRRK